ncbi:alpha/beta hydrolase [Halosquirtibacter laminarini]|uniref:Alpha/beta hydrolase n=1 Tax=Halosquirtibacter laminarini TaxID=3374600 RepID=A0AC61NGY5_9BACT|nr:alpha/beta hydrolase [Prolixibacteraceae bacterium]
MRKQENKEQLSYTTYTHPDHKRWIVFVHGAGGSSKTFSRQIAAFKKHFNLLLPDMRHHGGSQDLELLSKEEMSFDVVGQDILSLMDDLGIETAHFIGISMGAIVIRMVEQLAPERIDSIIIGGGVMKLNRRTHILFRAGLFFSKLIPYHQLYKMVAHILMPRENHAVARRLFVREAGKVKKEAFKSWLSLISGLKNKLDDLFIKPLAVPTLMITGAQDFAFLDDVREYASLFPFVRMAEIPKCGHVCNIEKADLFNKHSLDFLLSFKS